MVGGEPETCKCGIQMSNALVLAALIAVSVIIGWKTETQWLTTWGGGVTVKPVTAITLLGITIMVGLAGGEGLYRGVLSCVFSAAIGMYMALSVMTAMVASTWFIAEPETWADLSVAAGVPSLSTASLVLLWALAIYMRAMSQSYQVIMHGVAQLSVIVAAICYIGHLLLALVPGYPLFELMIYYLPEVSTAMAIPTAVIFLLVSATVLKHVPTQNA